MCRGPTGASLPLDSLFEHYEARTNVKQANHQVFLQQPKSKQKSAEKSAKKSESKREEIVVDVNYDLDVEDMCSYGDFDLSPFCFEGEGENEDDICPEWALEAKMQRRPKRQRYDLSHRDDWKSGVEDEETELIILKDLVDRCSLKEESSLPLVALVC